MRLLHSCHTLLGPGSTLKAMSSRWYFEPSQRGQVLALLMSALVSYGTEWQVFFVQAYVWRKCPPVVIEALWKESMVQPLCA